MVVNSNYETFLIEYEETNQLQILKKLLKKFLDDGKDVAIFNALTKAGIKSVADMMMLTDEDINNLTYEDTNAFGIKQQVQLTFSESNKINALKAYIRNLNDFTRHYETIKMDDFHNFVISIYNPNNK